MNIHLQNIGKRFRYEWIFKNINIKFESGNKYAITGANGSGKSTLMKVLSGHLSPSKGNIFYKINDKIIEKENVYQYVSYAAPYIQLPEEMTLAELLSFHQKFIAFQNNISTKNIIEILNFKNASKKEVRFFSSGMKQRLKLALAICSDSSLLLLDEPTTNLDTQGMKWYAQLLEEYTLANRLTIIASNVASDYAGSKEIFNIMDYKK